MDPLRRQVSRLRAIFPRQPRRILAGGAVAVGLVLAGVLFETGSLDASDLSTFGGAYDPRRLPQATNQVRTPIRAGATAFATPKATTSATPTPTPTASPTPTPMPTPTPTPTPVPVPAAGAVWSWGGNTDGQLGRGTLFGNYPAPGLVSGVSAVTAIAVPVAGEHSVALLGDGTVWTWGDNSQGQLGAGAADSLTPLQAGTLTGATAIAGGRQHTLALNADGTVTTWGGGLTTQSTVGGLDSVVALAGGDFHALALKSDGTVWGWGSNANGQLGDGTTTASALVQVSGLGGVIAIAAGAEHSLALRSDGTVWAWGVNEFGQCGDGSGNSQVLLPFQVPGLGDVTAIAAGARQSMALLADGTAWAWGQNLSGQLGDGTITSRPTAAAVSGLTGVTAIASGRLHGLALKSDGTLWAWGDNSYGQLGDGTFDESLVPVQVDLPASTTAKVTRIAASRAHNLVLYGDP
jgi:alpha-tubulin suppressor-like RCC1 family protein